MYFITRKITIIKEFASKIAELQRKADEWHYLKHDSIHSSWLLDQTIPLKEMCQKLGIFKQVYEESYKIYDYRNSGKKGYMLKDGKIIHYKDMGIEKLKGE